MSEALKTFLRQYAPFSEEQLSGITQKFQLKKAPKNSYVLRETEICNDLVIVEEGCLRLYYIQNDVEISVWFAFKGSSAVDIYSFISNTPSRYFLQAMEETVVWYLPKTELEKLYLEQPLMNQMMRGFWEDAVVQLIDRFSALQRDSAEQRYLDLLAKPQYFQRIPQKYLASFIGVTPTSLSRIRRKIR